MDSEGGEVGLVGFGMSGQWQGRYAGGYSVGFVRKCEGEMQVVE